MRNIILAVVVMTAALVAIPATASAADSPADCGGFDIFYQVEYTDGGLDQGCADKNEVTRADNPNLLANVLHVSCSDKFGLDGKDKTKSDLGGRQVAAYFIVKGLAKGKTKTCGVGTPVPAGGMLGYGLIVVAVVALAGGSAVVARGRRDSASLAV